MRSATFFFWLLCWSAAAAEYHISPGGNDRWEGTAARPFATIAAASLRMVPGDRCLIHAGTYRETLRPYRSGQVDKLIEYLAAAGEAVTITGNDRIVNQWKISGEISTVNLDGWVQQVFSGESMLPEARWPNSTPEQIMDYPRAIAAAGTDYDILVDPNLPAGNAAGGVVLLWNGARWLSSTRLISAYTAANSLKFDKVFKPENGDGYNSFDSYKPKAGNPYVIYGALSLLDAPGEWFHDGKTLSYIPIGKLETVEIRRRQAGADLSGRTDIHVKGIRFFAANVLLADSARCLIEDCHFRYMDYARQSTWPAVSGRDNVFRRCSFGYSAGPALRILDRDNRVEDCVIFDTNYTGTFNGAITAVDSTGTTITNCTILRTGRDGILHSGSKRITISYCDISNVNLLNSDAGGIYSWGSDGTESLIAYNYVHDNTGSMNAGIYLDNFCKGFTVHHNLVWNNSDAGVRLNSDALEHLIANNSLVNNGKPFATFAYTGRTLTQKGTCIVNNLVTAALNAHDPGCFAQGELAPQLLYNGKGAIDKRGVPLPGSTAIDRGIIVQGITNGHAGEAPDVGAYEAGGIVWTAGASRAPADMPKGLRTEPAWAPLPKITEKTMLTDGLKLWLDAADAETLTTDHQGRVMRWDDKSANKLEVIFANAAPSPKLASIPIAGKQVVAAGLLRFNKQIIGLQPVSFFMVASAPERPQAWERLISTWNKTGQDWESPNFCLTVEGGEHPTAFLPRVFSYVSRELCTLQNLTIGGSAIGNYHNFSGQIAEILLYSRALRNEEEEAVIGYLTEKWQIDR